MKKKATEDYNAIALWFTGQEESLNRQQLAIYGRIDQADNLISKYGSGKKTAEMLVRICMAKNPGYNLRQAYLDMEWAVELHNSRSRKSKEMEQLYAINIIKRQLRTALQKIKDPEKQSLVVARLLKEHREAVGYDKAEIDLPDFSGMGGNTYVISTNPEDAGFSYVEITDDIIAKYREPKANLYQKLEQSAEEVSHE